MKLAAPVEVDAQVLTGLPGSLGLCATGKPYEVFRESRVVATVIVGISGRVLLAKAIKPLKMLAPSPSPVFSQIALCINHNIYTVAVILLSPAFASRVRPRAHAYWSGKHPSRAYARAERFISTPAIMVGCPSPE